MSRSFVHFSVYLRRCFEEVEGFYMKCSTFFFPTLPLFLFLRFSSSPCFFEDFSLSAEISQFSCVSSCRCVLENTVDGLIPNSGFAPTFHYQRYLSSLASTAETYNTIDRTLAATGGSFTFSNVIWCSEHGFAVDALFCSRCPVTS